MDQVKRQLEEDREGPELEDIYKEKLASEIDKISRTLDHGFYEQIKNELPESLDAYFELVDPIQADSLDL